MLNAILSAAGGTSGLVLTQDELISHVMRFKDKVHEENKGRLSRCKSCLLILRIIAYE